MKRRIVLTALAFVVPLVFAVGVNVGQAVAGPPPKATGIANCRIFSGTGTLAPGLTPAGSPGGVIMHFTGSISSPAGGLCPNSNVTSPPATQIVGGTVTGTGIFLPPKGMNGSSCVNFDGPDALGVLLETITWTTVGSPIAPTTVLYALVPSPVSGAPTDTITLAAPPGFALKAGSFMAPSGTHTTQLQTDIPGPACGPGPYSSFNILGGFVLV